MVENKIINESILQRMRGVPANPATPESDADPRNPTARRSPNMAVPSCSDPNCHDPNCNYDNEPAPEAPGDVAALLKRAAEMPSSLNDACRTIELLSEAVQRSSEDLRKANGRMNLLEKERDQFSEQVARYSEALEQAGDMVKARDAQLFVAEQTFDASGDVEACSCPFDGCDPCPACRTASPEASTYSPNSGEHLERCCYCGVLNLVATPEAPGDVAAIVRELRSVKTGAYVLLRNQAADALERLSAVTAERDHYFKTLHAAADVMERHWKGAGLSNDFEWLSNEIAAYAKDQCTEIESLEARVAELSAEMARAESTIAGLNKKLTEQFELSTKYVGLHQAAEARLAEAVDLLGEARSGYIAGSEYDEAFDERKKSLLSRVG